MKYTVEKHSGERAYMQLYRQLRQISSPGRSRGARACLSRSAEGIRGKTPIVNLPGSEKAAKENLAVVLEALLHGMDMLCADGSSDHGHHHHHG